MAISNAMSTSLISASSSMKMVRTQQGAKKQMDGKAGVLEAEINLDGGRGGDTKKKEAELLGVQEKANKIESSQMNSISEMNENMKRAAKEDQKEQEAAKIAENAGVVYEKSGNTEDTKSATYKINKMSQSERDALVKQLKTDAEQRQSQLMDLVQKTLNGQVGALNKASEKDIWRTLASGDFTVDEATKTQAQKDIGEDGYWGVKQTSQRLFDFASALAGDDVDQMHKMQKAMEKGFKQATGAWGRELPSISKDTMDAANKLFEDYYKSKETQADPVYEA